MSGIRWTPEQLAALSKTREGAASQPATLVKKETANQITQNILRMVNSQPNCVAYRINNTGIWDPKKQLFRKSHTEDGIPDIWLCIWGFFATIEVKAGKDTQKDEQAKREFEIKRAKGAYILAHSTDEAEKWFAPFLEECKKRYKKSLQNNEESRPSILSD
jgi:hypothetical protein